MLALEVHDQPFDALALQAEIAARRTAAADHRQRRFLGVGAGVGLLHVDHRPDHHVASVVGDQPRRHRLERAGEERVQQQGLDHVVEVVAERDLGGADFAGESIQHAAPQAGAQRARRVAGVEDVVHHLADRGVLDAQFPTARPAGLGDDVVLVVLVAGVDVDGDQAEVDRRALAQHVEDLEQRPAVLAAREADHDAVAVLDESVLGDRSVTCLASRASSGDRYAMISGPLASVYTAGRPSPASSRCTVAGHVSSAARAAPAWPMRSAAAASSIRRRRPAATAAAVGAHTSPSTPSLTSSVGPPLSRHGHDRLVRGERLDGDEAVVFVERRERHRTAARQVVEELAVVEPADELDAPVEPEPPPLLEQRVAASPSPAITARMPCAAGCGQRVEQQVEPLERRQPRHREDVVAVAVAAIGARRRRWMEHVARHPAPPGQPRLHRRRRSRSGAAGP